MKSTILALVMVCMAIPALAANVTKAAAKSGATTARATTKESPPKQSFHSAPERVEVRAQEVASKPPVTFYKATSTPKPAPPSKNPCGCVPGKTCACAAL
jgi:hypothetical protein